MLDLSLSLHNVRLIKPDSEGEVHDLIVRIFIISFFVFSSITITRHIFKTNSPSLFFEIPCIKLTRFKITSAHSDDEIFPVVTNP